MGDGSICIVHAHKHWGPKLNAQHPCKSQVTVVCVYNHSAGEAEIEGCMGLAVPVNLHWGAPGSKTKVESDWGKHLALTSSFHMNMHTHACVSKHACTHAHTYTHTQIQKNQRKKKQTRNAAQGGTLAYSWALSSSPNTMIMLTNCSELSVS